MVLNLKGFKPGANVTLLNTYYKRFRDENNKFRDIIVVVFKDLDTGIKYKQEIVDPKVTYHIVKPDRRVSYNRIFAPADDLIELTAYKTELDKQIAKDLGLSDWFYDCIKSGDRERARSIHFHPDVFGSDINIEDLYRFEFGELYKNDPYPLCKSYLDIETDISQCPNDFVELGEVPINAVSFVCDGSKQVYTLLLRDHTNPQITEFEEFMNKYGFSEFRQFLKSHINQYDDTLYTQYELDEFSFNMAFYDEDKEIQLIIDLFKIINMIKPDFVLAWNMAFDIPYIMARIIKLGYNPADVMCHPDFEYKYAEYFVDERNKNTFEERGDFCIISSYSVYMDQLIQYASRRKGQTKEVSYSLDNIGRIAAKIGKLDYKHITTNLGDLPKKDYKTFVYYNIIDTIVQHCIEHVTEDLDYVFSKALNNNTRYSKVHRQTVYLANRGKKEFLHSDNLIMGNNFNKMNEKPTTKFPGAFVADPKKVSDYSRVRIAGQPVNIFDNCQDFDYSIVA